MLAYSSTTGARFRPVGSNDQWFEDRDPAMSGGAYGSALIGDTIYVALGAYGIVALDSATLEHLPSRSIRMQMGWTDTSIYTIAARSSGSVSASRVAGRTAGFAAAVPASPALILGGALTRWHDDTAGNIVEVTVASTIPSDTVKPTVSTPTISLRTGATLAGSAIPIHVAWSGSDGGGSGVDHYELARSTDGGVSWTTISSSLVAPSTNLTTRSSGTVRVRVRAVDRASNVGAWVTSRLVTPRLTQQTSSAVRYRHTWTKICFEPPVGRDLALCEGQRSVRFLRSHRTVDRHRQHHGDNARQGQGLCQRCLPGDRGPAVQFDEVSRPRLAEDLVDVRVPDGPAGRRRHGRAAARRSGRIRCSEVICQDGYRLRMLTWPPTDDEIEDMVFDALDALPRSSATSSGAWPS